MYPYKDFRVIVTKNNFAVFYNAYTDSQKSYYGRAYCEPLLSKDNSEKLTPIQSYKFVSNYNDAIKSSTVEFKTETAIPDKTCSLLSRIRTRSNHNL